MCVDMICHSCGLMIYTNGRGISTISKTATVGVVDTYTITYNDGTISTFTVTNGIDGTGSGNLSVSNTTVDNTKKYLIANAVKAVRKLTELQVKIHR